MRGGRPVAALNAAIAAALALGACTSSESIPAQDDTATIEGLVESRAPAGVGAVFLGVSEGDAAATAVAGRDGDGKPVTADTAWETASLVKMVVAAGVMQLVDQQLVILDAPVSDYIDFEVAPSIRVRDVLGHRSGIEDMTEHLSSCPTVATLEEMKVKAANAVGPTPSAEYSNTNYLLLGHLISQVTGVDVGEYIAANILDPLGMASTYWWETQDGPPVYWRQPMSDPGSVSPFTCADLDVTVGTEGRTFVSTLEDLDTFLRGLFGGALVSEASLAEMVPASAGDVGLGIWSETDDQRGVTLYGHFGSRSDFAAVAYYEPNTKRTIIAFANEPVDVEELLWDAWDLSASQN